MSISREKVKEVARLAALEIEESQLDEIARQLSKILNYIEKLNELDTSDVKPSERAVAARPDRALENVWRDDDRVGSEFKKEIWRLNAPAAEKDHFKTARVVE